MLIIISARHHFTTAVISSHLCPKYGIWAGRADTSHRPCFWGKCLKRKWLRSGGGGGGDAGREKFHRRLKSDTGLDVMVVANLEALLSMGRKWVHWGASVLGCGLSNMWARGPRGRKEGFPAHNNSRGEIPSCVGLYLLCDKSDCLWTGRISWATVGYKLEKITHFSILVLLL